MLSAANNKLLTETGPGTPMGEMFREYWIPAAMSSELKRDGDPMRLLLLSEQLVAFRDSNGKVGVMDHRCPHRGASLFFGRNEEAGLRCIYHGWKFDAEGACVDMANVPLGHPLRGRMRAQAYLVKESNGIIWVYMGKRRPAPTLPLIDVLQAPEDQVDIRFFQRECNYLQAMEGELDTSHVGILHFGLQNRANLAADDMRAYAVANRAPEYKIRDADFGCSYAAYRPADEGKTYWRYGQYLYPFWTMPPINYMSNNIIANAWVPMDDTHTMVMFFALKTEHHKKRLDANETIPGAAQDMEMIPNDTSWHGRWRITRNLRNDYLIDREAQRTVSFTGIQGIDVQDQAATESMGPIIDRTMEHLAPSDIMVTRVRRALRASVTAYTAENRPPISAERPEIYAGVRGGQAVAPNDVDWLDVYRREVEAAPWREATPAVAE